MVLSAVAGMDHAQVVPGITVLGPRNALIAALVIGFIMRRSGSCEVITFPLTLITLGLFWFVINALMLEFASTFWGRGFKCMGFWLHSSGDRLSLVNMLLKRL